MKGYRKLTVCMSALILAFVLALVGKLAPEFATVASIAVGAFTAANVVGDHKALGDGVSVKVESTETGA